MTTFSVTFSNQPHLLIPLVGVACGVARSASSLLLSGKKGRFLFVNLCDRGKEVTRTRAMAEGGVRADIVSLPSLEDHLSKFPPQVLDSPCTDDHLVKLTECFPEWQGQLATSLQLTAVEVEDIERAWPRDPARQRVQMFRKWRSQLSSRATYR